MKVFVNVSIFVGSCVFFDECEEMASYLLNNIRRITSRKRIEKKGNSVFQWLYFVGGIWL